MLGTVQQKGGCGYDRAGQRRIYGACRGIGGEKAMAGAARSAAAVGAGRYCTDFGGAAP